MYIYIYTGAPLSYPSLAYLSHLPPPTRVLHTLREREKCVCFESGIISSIKSGLVPRECSVCVLACSIRDPPQLGTNPLLDDPRSSNPFQLSSTTAPPSFLPSTSFHATRIPPLPNGTEQVDNLRIIQKLVPLLSTQSFPFSLSSSVPFYSPANHFESAGLLTRLINACPSPLPRRRRTFFREKGKEEYSKEGEKEIIIETPVDSLVLDRARTNIACLQSNFA